MNTQHSPHFCFLSILAAALMAGGCSTMYRFEVDAVLSPTARAVVLSYRLTSAHPTLGPGDPLFDQVAANVRAALSSKGMYDAPEGTPVGYEIEIDFGLDPPKVEMRKTQQPVYAEVPAISMTSAPAAGDRRNFAGPRQTARQIIDFKEHVYPVVLHPKFLRITARSVAEPDSQLPGVEQWSVYVKNEDESQDLPHHLPLMVAAAMDSIGDDHASPHRVVLTDRDGRVTFVEEGVSFNEPADSGRPATTGTQQPRIVVSSIP